MLSLLASARLCASPARLNFTLASRFASTSSPPSLDSFKQSDYDQLAQVMGNEFVEGLKGNPASKKKLQTFLSRTAENNWPAIKKVFQEVGVVELEEFVQVLRNQPYIGPNFAEGSAARMALLKQFFKGTGLTDEEALKAAVKKEVMSRPQFLWFSIEERMKPRFKLLMESKEFTNEEKRKRVGNFMTLTEPKFWERMKKDLPPKSDIKQKFKGFEKNAESDSNAKRDYILAHPVCKLLVEKRTFSESGAVAFLAKYRTGLTYSAEKMQEKFDALKATLEVEDWVIDRVLRRSPNLLKMAGSSDLKKLYFEQPWEVLFAKKKDLVPKLNLLKDFYQSTGLSPKEAEQELAKAFRHRPEMLGYSTGRLQPRLKALKEAGLKNEEKRDRLQRWLHLTDPEFNKRMLQR